jgi:STAS domain-containing protein
MGIQIQDSTADRLVIELGPAFGTEDARRLHELLERAEPGTAVEIDFHSVTECQATALGQLARDVAGAHTRIALLGMRWHEKRLLGYLGVPLDVAEGRPA